MRAVAPRVLSSADDGGLVSLDTLHARREPLMASPRAERPLARRSLSHRWRLVRQYVDGP